MPRSGHSCNADQCEPGGEYILVLIRLTDPQRSLLTRWQYSKCMNTPRFRKLASVANSIRKEEGYIELVRRTANFAQPYISDIPSAIKGRYKSELSLECDQVQVTIDTNSKAAKKFYYPRYIDGQLHEPPLTRAIIRSLSSDSVFYDIGAAVGYYTVFASEVCFDGCVHSFEIDPEYVASIEDSVELNGNASHTQISQKAVSNESNSTVEFIGMDGAGVGRTNRAGRTYTTSTITLDEYISNNPVPDVLKIDVEGFEYHVLDGFRSYLDSDNIDKIFLEIHPDGIEEYGHSVEETISILADSGFDCQLFDHRETGNTNDFQLDNLTGNTMLVCE